MSASANEDWLDVLLFIGDALAVRLEKAAELDGIDTSSYVAKLIRADLKDRADLDSVGLKVGDLVSVERDGGLYYGTVASIPTRLGVVSVVLTQTSLAKWVESVQPKNTNLVFVTEDELKLV